MTAGCISTFYNPDAVSPLFLCNCIDWKFILDKLPDRGGGESVGLRHCGRAAFCPGEVEARWEPHLCTRAHT